MDTNKKPIYPVEPWNITETEFRVENNYRNETTFALSNGYIGTRGTFEEAYVLTLIQGWKETLSTGFMRARRSGYGRPISAPLSTASLFLNCPTQRRSGCTQAGRNSIYRKARSVITAVCCACVTEFWREIWSIPRPAASRCAYRSAVLYPFRWKNIMEIRYCVHTS